MHNMFKIDFIGLGDEIARLEALKNEATEDLHPIPEKQGDGVIVTRLWYGASSFQKLDASIDALLDNTISFLKTFEGKVKETEQNQTEVIRSDVSARFNYMNE